MNHLKLALLTLVGAMALSSEALAQSTGKRLNIRSITASGTGCPTESFSTYVSEDAQAFTLSFDRYSVELASGLERSARKNCEILMEMNVAPGWTFALVQADARGYAGIDTGIAATMRMYSRQGRKPYMHMSKTELKGDYYGDYLSSGKVPVSAYQWSSCSSGSKLVNIFTDLNLQRLPSKNIAYAELSSVASDANAAVGSLVSLMMPLVGSKAAPVRSAEALRTAVMRLATASNASRHYGTIRAEANHVLNWWNHLQHLLRHDKRLKNNVDINQAVSGMTAWFDAIDGLSRGENPSAAGLMTVDTLDGEMTQKYAIAWKRCS